MELDLTKKSAPATNQVDENVDYTIRILDALQIKAKEHNDTNDFKVSPQQLKSVFVVGASEKVEEHTLTLCGFARVNMYLRLLDPAVVAHEFKIASNNKNFKKLVFDFSSHISPKSDDFAAAEEDLKKHNLNFDFTSIDELYLEDVKNCAFYMSYI